MATVLKIMSKIWSKSAKIFNFPQHILASLEQKKSTIRSALLLLRKSFFSKNGSKIVKQTKNTCQRLRDDSLQMLRSKQFYFTENLTPTLRNFKQTLKNRRRHEFTFKRGFTLVRKNPILSDFQTQNQTIFSSGLKEQKTANYKLAEIVLRFTLNGIGRIFTPGFLEIYASESKKFWIFWNFEKSLKLFKPLNKRLFTLHSFIMKHLTRIQK